MASIKMYTAKDGAKNWRVRYRLQGRSCSKTFANQRSAEAFGEMVDRWGPEQALEFIKEPTTPRAKTVTVADCVERYVALRKGVTCKIYRDEARLHINPTLGTMPISKLTPEAVQLWVYRLDVSAKTVRLAHSVLSGALALAMTRGELQGNPAAKVSKSNPTGIRLPRTHPVTEPVFLSNEEYELVLDVIPVHYKLVVEFLAATGCRIGEALALTPANVNMRTGKVKFNRTFSRDENGKCIIGPTKTESSEREIAVPRRILEQLDLSHKHVFTTTQGTILNPCSFRSSVWNRSMRNVDLPVHRVPRIHDLRHTHASWLLNAGVSIHAVQQRLGHSSVMTTLHTYGHAAADSEDRILKILA